MTIARDAAEQSNQGPIGRSSPPRGLSSGRLDGDDAPVPQAVRRERLEAQIASFVRAGYRVETRAGDAAVVVRPSTAKRRLDVAFVAASLGIVLIPWALGRRSRRHRVVITVDRTGVVRLA